MSKIERVYLRGDFGLTGLYCKAHDVDQLEATNAELLEALEWLVTIQSIVSIPEAMHNLTYQRAVEQAEAAIAKAKEVMP